MPGLFVPARDSRHRAACFALYKALIRQSVRVPLPDDVVRPPGLEGPVHPLKHLVRKGFRRNKNDTSSRLVISALRNGYKFLDMLVAAQSQSTPEYASIHAFIRDLNHKKSDGLSRRALKDKPPPPPSSAPNPNTIPLITRVSKRREPARYEPTIRPRPLSELGGSGIRRVPVLENANGTPFLRLTKPQPAILSRVILQKTKHFTKLWEFWRHVEEVSRPEAQTEDRWESILQKHLGVRPDSPGKTREFEEQMTQAAYDARGRIIKRRYDEHARGVALQKIVREERALAEKERTERRERRRREREALRGARGVSVLPESSVEAVGTAQEVRANQKNE